MTGNVHQLVDDRAPGYSSGTFSTMPAGGRIWEPPAIVPPESNEKQFSKHQKKLLSEWGQHSVDGEWPASLQSKFKPRPVRTSLSAPP